MNTILLAVVTTTADYMARWNVYPSDEADAWITAAVKTVKHYERVMRELVHDLYNERITPFDFESGMLDLIANQYRRAWNEGMRLAGLSPADMTAEMERLLQEAMSNELQYVQGLIDDILAGRINGVGFDSFYNRVDMWANRYVDIRNRAKIAAGMLLGKKYVWRRGPTSDGCLDCVSYDGQVKTAAEWDEIFRTTGHRPQSHTLGCKGFRCLCELELVE